jgi:hypothetical protein
MTDFEKHLWSHLVTEHDADDVLPRESGERSHRRRRPLALGSAAGVTGITAVALTVALSATTAVQKAYALTENPNGTLTLTLSDAATAIPEVNAEFAKMGIAAKVIPVTATCTVTNTGGISLNPPTAGVTASSSVTFSTDIPAGWTDFIAAEQTPSGVREVYGSSSQPLPACLNSNQAPPTIVGAVTSTTSSAAG